MARSLRALALSALACAGGAQVVSRLPIAGADMRAEFSKFVEDFSKEYASEGEREMRFSIFESNVLHFMEHNSKNESYTLGINEFADMTPLELARNTGLKIPDAEELKNLKVLTDRPRRRRSLVAPPEVDWVKDGAVTPVKNQYKDKCGSCWSFSITGALEGAWKVASGKLVSMSEQQLMDCARRDGCDGGYPRTDMKWSQSHKVCTDESYPYTASDGHSCRSSSCSVAIPKGSIIAVRDVSRQGDEIIMQALAGRPCSVAIFARGMHGYHSGVFTGCSYNRPDHAALLVGYGKDGRDYWKMKNSFGTSWGEQGYIRLLRGGGSTADRHLGPCGILGQVLYFEMSGSRSPWRPRTAKPIDSTLGRGFGSTNDGGWEPIVL